MPARALRLTVSVLLVDDLATGRRLPLHPVPAEGGCRPIRARVLRQVQRCVDATCAQHARANRIDRWNTQRL